MDGSDDEDYPTSNLQHNKASPIVSKRTEDLMAQLISNSGSKKNIASRE